MRRQPSSPPPPRHARSGIAVALLILAAPLAGCRKATEIVLTMTVSPASALPAHYTVKVSRPVPFDTTPTTTPPFVQASLGERGELLFDVTATSATTQLSLLPSDVMPIVIGTRDLTISFIAPGFTVAPPNPQPLSFTDGESKEIRFLLMLLPPDMGAPDGGKGLDGGARDAAMPVDMTAHD